MVTNSPFIEPVPDPDDSGRGGGADAAGGEGGGHKNCSDTSRKRTKAQLKAEGRWQEGLWGKWPSKEAWPAKLTVYEAAAYLRVSPDSIRTRLRPGRDRRAELAHQRIGTSYRIDRAELDNLGRVLGRQK